MEEYTLIKGLENTSRMATVSENGTIKDMGNFPQIFAQLKTFYTKCEIQGFLYGMNTCKKWGSTSPQISEAQ
jgi:hypothetical protein